MRLLVCYIPLVNNALQTNTDVYSTHGPLNCLQSLRTIAGIEGAWSDSLLGARGASKCTALRRTQIGSRDAKRDRRKRTTMQSTPATPNAAPPTTPDTPDTPETLLLDADAELRASHHRAPTPETVLTGADAELRAVLRETPQRARAAV